MNEVTRDDILQAAQRIHRQLPPTPLIRSHGLEQALGVPVWLKCELFQITGSFKARGALNWVQSATLEELEHGLITLSAGNHAQGLAWAAQSKNVPVTVVMPEGSSPFKIKATERYGAKVILHGDINAAMAKVDELQQQTGRTLVHPYNNPRIIAGQGTIGLEILDQLPEVAQILCPIGGGGLISGIGVAVKSAKPAVELIGFEPERAATLKTAWEHHGPTRLRSVNTLAASLAASLAGDLTYPITRQVVDRILTISEADIRYGLLQTFERCKLFAEPGSVLPMAALLRGHLKADPGGHTVIIVSGGNFDLPILKQLL